MDDREYLMECRDTFTSLIKLCRTTTVDSTKAREMLEETKHRLRNLKND